MCVRGPCVVRAAAGAAPHVPSGTAVACHLGLSPPRRWGPGAGGRRRRRRGNRAPQGDGALCVDGLLLVSPLQPGRQDHTSCHGELGERVAPKTQHWEKPIGLISPALHFSFAQTAASDLVNSGLVHSRAHWSLCVEGIKPVMLQRNYVQELHLHQKFQLLLALKLEFTKCHRHLASILL